MKDLGIVVAVLLCFAVVGCLMYGLEKECNTTGGTSVALGNNSYACVAKDGRLYRPNQGWNIP